MLDISNYKYVMFASGDAKFKFFVLQCCLSLKVKHKTLFNHAETMSLLFSKQINISLIECLAFLS